MQKQFIIYLLLFLNISIAYSRHTLVGIDNDALMKTDFYYTHSQYFSFSDRIDSTNRFYNILSPQLQKNSSFSFGVYQLLHTPHNIKTKNIQYGDMPYSGELFVNAELSSYIKKYKTMLATSINLGVIGELAGGKNTQSFIHSFSKNAPEPMGWNNQITNDLLCNFNFLLSVETIKYKFFTISQTTKVNIGTYDISFAGGTDLKLGLFDFKNPNDIRKYEDKITAFIKISALVRLKYYDARFLGGMFNNSKYLLPYKDMNNLVYSLNLQSFFIYKNYGVDLNIFIISPEILSGDIHKYNSIKIYYFF